MHCILINLLILICLRQIFTHLLHSAYCDCRCRRIPGLSGTVSENQIPVAYIILWKSVEEIICHSLEQIKRFPNIGISVVQCDSVDSPRLTSCPCRIIRISLTCDSFNRFSCLRIKIKCVISGCIILTYMLQEVIKCSLAAFSYRSSPVTLLFQYNSGMFSIQSMIRR